MEFQQVVEERRAVRHHLPATIEKPVIEGLIRTAALAPSAMNLQPWGRAVTRGTAQIEQYAHRTKACLTATSDIPPVLHGLPADPAFGLFHQAPVLILVIAQSAGEQAREDCCLAAQTLMLAARSEGLGIADSHHVVAPIVLGMPVAWPPPHGRVAPEIHWIGQALS